MKIVHTYFKRGRCPVCNDVLWTTDTIVPVTCSCGATTIHPDKEDNSLPISDAEFLPIVYMDLSLDDSDILIIERG